jgi:hypothetical protein
MGLFPGFFLSLSIVDKLVNFAKSVYDVQGFFSGVFSALY